MNRTKIGAAAIGLAALCFVTLLTFLLFAQVVGPDEFLVLTSKFGASKPEGKILADPGERGVLRATLGTGRHFVNPVFYTIERHRAVTIPPTKIGIVTAKDGPLPKSGTIIAERGEKGVWRDVLGPGTYKLNPRGFTIEIVDMVRIPPGMVGVLINKITSAVEERTLPPGLHKVNSRLYKVNIIDMGVKHLGRSRPGNDVIDPRILLSDEIPIEVSAMTKPVGGAMEFPSKDGFTVALDASVIYEIEPGDARNLIREFGTTDVLTQRIIDPALNSVTRNVGSTATAKEIIQGETRLAFQELFTAGFLKELAGKPVKALDALPRGLYVPPKIRLPIMQATIKGELKLTNQEIELTTVLKNTEEEERKKINLEIEKVKSETEFEVTNIVSESSKEVAQFEAETASQIASIRLELARIDAKTLLISSSGEAEIVEYRGAKEAELRRRKAAALGGLDNLVMLSFVESLPEKINFRVLHAGEGTFWTDLPGLSREQGALLERARAAGR
jgi:hypothetical protein